MSPVIVDLVLRTVRGRLRRWLRLLRNPRYLVAFVVGVAYFAWAFARPWLAGAAAGHEGGLVAVLGPQLHGLLAIVLALAATLAWLLLPGRPALRLNPAELEILMPAPLARRDIIAYALLKEQPAILFGAFLVSVGSFSVLPAAWAVLTLAALHAKVCELTKARLREGPALRTWSVRGLVLAGLAAYWIVLAGAVRHAWWLNVVRPGAATTPTDLIPGLVRAFTAPGLARTLLSPFLLVAAPLAAPSTGLLIAGWGALAVLLALHVVWVVHTQVRFEEATLDRARRRAAARDPRLRYTRLTPTARRRVPFALPPGGRPETAVLWKAAVQVVRRPLGGVAAGLLGGVVVGGLALSRVPDAALLAAILTPTAAVLGFVALFVPLMVRVDLRLDLTRLDLVRPWPLAGWRLVLADSLAPAAAGWVVAAAAAGVVVVVDLALRVVPGGGPTGLAHGLVPARLLPVPGVPEAAAVPLAALGVFVVLAALVALHAAVVNLGVVLLPGWIPLGQDRPRGPAAFGQSLLAGVGLMLVLLVGLVPAMLVVAAVLAVQAVVHLPLVAWELPLLGVLAALPLLAEAALAVGLAGLRLDRLDPTTDLLDATS